MDHRRIAHHLSGRALRDRRAVMALASRVLVLHHGATIAQGAPEAVVREPAVIASYLGVEAAG